jgi:hypothetical protein
MIPQDKKWALPSRRRGQTRAVHNAQGARLDESENQHYLHTRERGYQARVVCSVLSVNSETVVHTLDRSDLSVPEREEYIKAVLCLQSKPPKVPKATAPGAKSRFDDFVAFHM